MSFGVGILTSYTFSLDFHGWRRELMSVGVGILISYTFSLGFHGRRRELMCFHSLVPFSCDFLIPVFRFVTACLLAILCTSDARHDSGTVYPFWPFFF